MTATEFFRKCKEHCSELDRGIGCYYSFSTAYTFKVAVEKSDYASAYYILLQTQKSIPKGDPIHDLINELLEVKVTKKIRKFYVGSQSVATAIRNGGDSHITYSDIDLAVIEAKNLIKNGKTDCAIVVEIKRIIRKANPEPPITVEEV